MTKRPNTFAAKMQAALTATVAADRAFALNDKEAGRALMLQAHAATAGAALEAEGAA